MFDKEALQTKMKKLQAKNFQIRDAMDIIKEKYDRPTQWIKDEKYRALSAERQNIQEEISYVAKAIGNIEDQEWLARQEEIYGN
jgi:hypothetical protein